MCSSNNAEGEDEASNASKASSTQRSLYALPQLKINPYTSLSPIFSACAPGVKSAVDKKYALLCCGSVI